MSIAIALQTSLSRFIARRREIRSAVRTERILGALPPHVRKDIGWPDLWNGPRRMRR